MWISAMANSSSGQDRGKTDGGAICNKVVREGFSNEVALEQRCGIGEGRAV